MLVSPVKESTHSIYFSTKESTTSASVLAVFYRVANLIATDKVMHGISKTAFSHCESKTPVMTYRT